MQEMRVRSPGREDPLSEGTATHSSLLTWRIPWTEEPGGLQSIGLKELGTTKVTWHMHVALYTLSVGKKWLIPTHRGPWGQALPTVVPWAGTVRWLSGRVALDFWPPELWEDKLLLFKLWSDLWWPSWETGHLPHPFTPSIYHPSKLGSLGRSGVIRESNRRYPSFNLQSGLIICHPWWIVHLFLFSWDRNGHFGVDLHRLKEWTGKVTACCCFEPLKGNRFCPLKSKRICKKQSPS